MDMYTHSSDIRSWFKLKLNSVRHERTRFVQYSGFFMSEANSGNIFCSTRVARVFRHRIFLVYRDRQLVFDIARANVLEIAKSKWETTLTTPSHSYHSFSRPKFPAQISELTLALNISNARGCSVLSSLNQQPHRGEAPKDHWKGYLRKLNISKYFMRTLLHSAISPLSSFLYSSCAS
jgi:hypothetical protein